MRCQGAEVKGEVGFVHFHLTCLTTQLNYALSETISQGRLVLCQSKILLF